jgi:hypothetical protein
MVTTIIRCDKCLSHVESPLKACAARNELQAIGWRTRLPGGKDLCPNCKTATVRKTVCAKHRRGSPGASCQLPIGHDGRHFHEDGVFVATWTAK